MRNQKAASTFLGQVVELGSGLGLASTFLGQVVELGLALTLTRTRTRTLTRTRTRTRTLSHQVVGQLFKARVTRDLNNGQKLAHAHRLGLLKSI